VDDVQTPLISGIFSRTEILSTLDLSSGLRDTKEPGLPWREGSAFSCLAPAKQIKPTGGPQGGADGPPAQENRGVVPHVLREGKLSPGYLKICFEQTLHRPGLLPDQHRDQGAL
jgi:hypothetical protein